MYNEYFNPTGISGIGKDIGWCGRNVGGKRCGLCKHHANFKEWSNSWHWYYLIQCNYNGYHRYAEGCWYKLWKAHSRPTSPVKYNIRGLKPGSINSLIKRGCKPNRRCKCVSIIQRGYWYCPKCWQVLNKLALMRRVPIHDLMIIPRQDLKEEMLILLLSGSL